jgi:hypothetical protein
MARQDHLADAANTLFPCILALRGLGFTVTRTDLESGELWQAAREDLLLTADDPIRLLGLATLWRDRGPEWRATEEQLEELLSEYVPGRVTSTDAD